ncbi:MAG: hypothetical protein Q9215_000371 [Flavoplaca cf. flavocitrina]
MPTTTSKPSAKHGGPTFKPPLPRSSKTTNSQPAGKRKSAPATTISSSGSDDEIPSQAAAKTTDSEDDLHSSSAGVAGPTSTQDSAPVIPPKLITRTLYHHLGKDEGDAIKIGKEANALAGKYFDTFVREAIARAAFERTQADEENGAGDGFLEVRKRLHENVVSIREES